MSVILKKNYPVMIVILAILYFLSPSLRQPFDLIDDHDIIAHYQLGQEKFSFNDFYWSLRKTNYLESEGRFRPALFFLKSLQVFAFQKQYQYWRFAELLIALVTGIIFYFTLVKFTPPVLAAFLALLAFSGIHASAWMRLLTTESWGLCFYSIGFYLGLPKTKLEPFPILRFTLALGFLWLAALTKESFLPLLPLSVGVLLFVIPKVSSLSYALSGVIKQRSIQFLVVGSSLGFLVHATALWSVLRTISSRYLHYSFVGRWVSFSPTTRLWLLKNGWIAIALFVLYECILFMEHKRWTHAKFFRDQWQVVLGVLFCAGVWLLPQWVVYGNMLTFQHHYMLPLNLFFVFLSTFLFNLAFYRVRKLSSFIVFASMVLTLVSFELGWLMDNHRESASRSKKAVALHELLRTISDEVKSHPGSKLVYFTEVGNYEEMESVTRYLREYTQLMLKPHLMVDWTGSRKNVNAQVENWLRDAQTEGNQYYAPNSSLNGPSPHVIGIYFSGKFTKQYFDKLFVADLFS